MTTSNTQLKNLEVTKHQQFCRQIFHW